MRKITDTRVNYLLTEDPREAKQPNWMQDSVNGLRGLVRDMAEELAVLRGEKPREGSEMLLEVGEADGEKFVGLGHRPRIRVPIGAEVWPANGQPKHYLDVEPGREYRYGKRGAEPQPVSHLVVRSGGGGLMVPMGSAINVCTVYLLPQG